MTLLQKSILSTIAYYDTLDYPLTSLEVFKYLCRTSDHAYRQADVPYRASLSETRKALESKELKKFIKEKNGFYFLKDREKLIRIRIDRQKIADQKWKKAKKIIRWLQIIPYLRMIAISGSLALNNTRKESDFDLLIVVRDKRIWLTRFLITLMVQLMSKRRHKSFTKDRICLNHYITDKYLEIKFMSLYNAQTYAHMIPVLEIQKGIYKKFQKNNSWAKNYLASWPELNIRHNKSIKANFLLRGIAKIGETCLDGKVGNLLEKFVKKIQEPLIQKNPLTHKKGGRVTVDDTQLEFHPNSPERKILDKYNKSMLQLGLKELQQKDSGLL